MQPQITMFFGDGGSPQNPTSIHLFVFAAPKHFDSFVARGTFQKACLATNGWQQPTRVHGSQSLRVHDLRGS